MLKKLVGFVADRRQKNAALLRYDRVLTQFVLDGARGTVPAELAGIVDEHAFTRKDLLPLHRMAVEELARQVSEDRRITREEAQRLEGLTHSLGYSSLAELGLKLDSLGHFLLLAEIEAGRLPATTHIEGSPLILEDGEVYHWGAAARLVKWKSVTTTVRYGGVTASFRIMKGVRYRVGSLRVERVSEDQLVREDEGGLVLTSQRIAFLGNRKKFAFKYGALLAVNVSPAGLEFSKKGKEAPYILQVADTEVPALILSAILNPGPADPPALAE
jgi:hypothetical protein